MMTLTKRLVTTVGLPVAIATSLLSIQPVLAAGVTDKLSNRVVIAAVKPNSFFQDEYIELYNPTSSAIDATALKVHFVAADGTDTLKTITPVAGHATTIKPGGFYLIASSVSLLASGPADATYDWTTSQLVDNGAVYISTSDAAGAGVQDLVGWGSSATAEATPAANPGINQTLERLYGLGEGNGVDTNNNSADFVVRDAVTAKNTAAPAEYPALPVISNVTPVNGSYTNDTHLTVSAKVADSGAGIADASSIVLWIDGANFGPVTYDAAMGIASRAVILGDGTHTARFVVTDRAGLSDEASTTFTVDTAAPTLSLAITDAAPTTNKLATTVKLTASDDPAGKASGVSEMRIAFDGVLDNEAWEPFQSVVTRNLMNKAGFQVVVAQVRDRAGNVSNTASASTTFVIGPTNTFTSPATPLSSTVSTATGNKITITWGVVPGATSYLVRYTDGQVLYGPIKVNGTSTVIEKLDPNKKYSFEVAAVNETGLVSAFSKITPEAPKTVAATTATNAVENPTGGPVATGYNSGTSAPSETIAPSPSPSVSPAPSPSPSAGEIKSSQDNQPRDWTRVIVALSILIIAAGVATGGWYLYQWWTTRPNENDKGKGKGGRW
jgi:hypothetical protein